MRNLAGNKDASDWCELELRRADVPIVIGEHPEYGDVKSRVTGQLGPFTFSRAWYYWVIKGPTPEAMATALYFDPIGKIDVRVDGDCTRPAPSGGTVDSYHIDSQDGLTLFAMYARRFVVNREPAT